MLPGVLTLRAERGHRSLPVGGGGGAPFVCPLFHPSIPPKSHMCFEKPPKKWLFETHVASRRIGISA